MTVPTYDRFIDPVLRFLATHPQGVAAKEAHEAAADALGVSDADRLELLPSSSQPIYKNRAGWAHDRLKRAGLSSSPKRGTWKITPQGLDFVESDPGPLSAEASTELAMGLIGAKLRPQPDRADKNATNHHNDPGLASNIASPDDRLGEALQEIRQAAESELLELLGKVSPSFFETGKSHHTSQENTGNKLLWHILSYRE